MGISFDQPVPLGLLLPGLLLVVVVWRGSRAYLPPVRRYAVLVRRLLAVSLLILAPAAPT